MPDKELTQQAYEVPLQEQLSSVPDKARLVIDDPDGMGTRFIPVGRMCNEAAAELRRQEARLTEAERVMKQALEALEAMNPYPASQEDQRDAAITALRERLEGKK